MFVVSLTPHSVRVDDMSALRQTLAFQGRSRDEGEVSPVRVIMVPGAWSPTAPLTDVLKPAAEIGECYA